MSISSISETGGLPHATEGAGDHVETTSPNPQLDRKVQSTVGRFFKAIAWFFSLINPFSSCMSSRREEGGLAGRVTVERGLGEEDSTRRMSISSVISGGDVEEEATPEEIEYARMREQQEQEEAENALIRERNRPQIVECESRLAMINERLQSPSQATQSRAKKQKAEIEVRLRELRGLSPLHEAMTTKKTFKFFVGTLGEPQRSHFEEGQPQIGTKIAKARLEDFSGLGVTCFDKDRKAVTISGEKEFTEKVASGFRDYDVYDRVTFNAPKIDFQSGSFCLEKVARSAGLDVAEAFGPFKFNVSNPVSVFQVMMQNHFDPKNTDETSLESELGSRYRIIRAIPEERPKLTLLPNQSKGMLKFIVEADEIFQDMDSGKRVIGYRVRQEVTIRPPMEEMGPAHVTIVRTAQVK